METKVIIKLFCVVLVAGSATTAAIAGDIRYLDEARQVFGQTTAALGDCGLMRLDADDPRLPRPQVPAYEAIVDEARRVLAYANYEAFVPGNLLELKNPNGGHAHMIRFGSEGIQYLTPQNGIVAQTTRFRDVNGWHQRYQCGSRVVDRDAYVACIESHWSRVVTSQLCR